MMYSSTVLHRLDHISNQKAYQHIIRLAGDIGVRIAGTDQEKQGMNYLAGVFSGFGLLPVVERFPHPIWHEVGTVLEIVGKNNQYIPAMSVCFGGTGLVEGQVIAVGNPSTLADIQHLDLEGKIAMIDGRDVQVDYPDNPQTDLLLDRGVLGLIFVAGESQLGGLPQAYYNYKRWFKGGTPPAVIVSYADSQRMTSRRVRMQVEADVSWSESANITVEIPGTERRDEIILVSAHHDTTPTSPGATDNAGGCAIVAELARMYLLSGAPKRTIRFIQFGGHETGIHGSETWLRHHLNDIEKIVAVINFDGQGALEGEDYTWLLGSDHWFNLIQKVISQGDYSIVTKIEPAGVDMMNFSALGIAGVNLGRHSAGNRAHTPFDNLEGTGPAGLEPGLMFGGALLSALADSLDFGNKQRMPWNQLRIAREYCLRWGWGIVS